MAIKIHNLNRDTLKALVLYGGSQASDACMREANRRVSGAIEAGVPMCNIGSPKKYRHKRCDIPEEYRLIAYDYDRPASRFGMVFGYGLAGTHTDVRNYVTSLVPEVSGWWVPAGQGLLGGADVL